MRDQGPGLTATDPGADAVPGNVTQIAEALRDDPILLTASMGNGATADLDARLHAKLDDVGHPVYVVITTTPAGYGGYDADEELVSLIHAELDADGIYYVQTSQSGGHLAVYGDIDPDETNDDTLLSLAVSTAMRQVHDAVADAGPDLDVPAVTEAGVLLDVAARAAIPDYEEPVLSDAEVASYTSRPWVSVGYDIDVLDHEPMSVGLGAVVGVTVAIVVATGAYRLLRATTGIGVRRRAAATRARGAVAEAREAATTAIALLDEHLQRESEGDRELATQCAETAGALSESDDLLDLVGVEVLARTGVRLLEGEDGYRCCYLDPRHGEAPVEASIGGGLSVPTCRACKRILDAGSSPEPLMDGEVPYYEGRSVWARTGYGATTETLWADVDRSLRR